jgi:hypothetical protein
MNAAENLVQLPHPRPLVALIDSPSTIKLIQAEILRSKLTYTAIATKAALAISTVGNIASGQTKLPRLETTIRLLGALGWVIQARRGDQ